MERGSARDAEEVGIMTLRDAKKIVLSSYPQSFMHQYGIGRLGGTTYVILSESSICGDQEQLGIIYRPYDHTMTRDQFKSLVWKQAAHNIMRKMVQRLET
jgi:hypothetical protein